MNQYDQIQDQISRLKMVFETEVVSLQKALNCILQEDVIADTHMPPFDKSAMDGYACRKEDIENEMEMLEVIHAGMVPTKTIRKNQCSKIMTGAKVPEGADCVFMVEHSVEVDGNNVRCTNPKSNINICYKGEDYQVNDVLIQKGTIISPAQIAVLAGAGYHQVRVSVRPKVGLITTGTELVEPDQKPADGQIRNSNGSQIISQVERMGLSVNNYGIIEDDYNKLVDTFDQAIQENDFIIFTGGASVGDFDWVPKILKDQGFDIRWEKTGIKPGNPMTFSIRDNKYCFGLAGNPVSSLVQFEIFIKPVIYKLMGGNYQSFRIKSMLDFNYSRKKTDRLQIVPVVINREGNVEEVPFNGSAHINALVYANAFMEVPLGQAQINKGDLVYVRPL